MLSYDIIPDDDEKVETFIKSTQIPMVILAAKMAQKRGMAPVLRRKAQYGRQQNKTCPT